MTQPVAPHRKKSKPIRWIILLVLLSAGGFGIYTRYFREVTVAPAPPIAMFERSGTVLARQFTLTIYASGAERADEASQAALKRAEEILRLVEPGPDSALAQLNASDPDKLLPVPPDLFTLIAAGREYAEVTNGAYDPTRGAVTAMWRKALAQGEYPSREAFAEVRRLSNWGQLAIQNEARSVLRYNDELKIDLSGLVMGYCLDEMMVTLQSKGVRSALIISGSEARVSNPPPGQEAWIVAIKRPNRTEPDGIRVHNCGISTAQVDDTTVQLAGRKVLAELDPTTGLAASGIVTATVVAPRCVMAQALANAAKTSPLLVAGFSPATDIHSRIYTPEQAYLSSGFPKVVAYEQATAIEATPDDEAGSE